MIRLTRIDYDGNKKPIIIDAESIESIEEGEKHTKLTTKRGWTIYIAESQAEVARKVLEWRLEIEAYKSLVTISGAESARCAGNLRRLAGLEEPRDE